MRLPFLDSTHARRVDVGDGVDVDADARARAVRARLAAGGGARARAVEDVRIVGTARAAVTARVERGTLSTREWARRGDDSEK